MIRIDGAAIAQKIIDGLKARPRLQKSLAVVLVGNDKASLVFVRRKCAVARELGIIFTVHQFSVSDRQDAVIDCIRQLSDDAQVGGIVIQLPVPHGFNRDALIAALDPKKDVDNLTGMAEVEAPAVGAVKEVLAFCKWQMAHCTIAVVGRGFLVGAPIIKWLEDERFMIHDSLLGPALRGFGGQARLVIKVADIETPNLQEFVADADMVITGVGKTGLIDLRWLKDGAGIIDFGFPPDIKQEGLGLRVRGLGFYTPTPGGTGPILVAKLFENVYALNNE